LPVIALALMRGQVDVLVLLLLAGFLAAVASGRPFAGGLSLAAAICIKIFPAFLLILPLWRRDGRCLAGCLAGLFLGLWLIPAIVLGPSRVLDLSATQMKVVLGPALGMGDHGARAEELLDARATVNQSFQMAVHLILHFGQIVIPVRPAPWVRGLHWLMTGGLTVLVLWRHGRPAVWDGQQIVSVSGLLTVVMLLACPVCHLHYFTLVVPLVMAIVARLCDKTAPSLWGAMLFLLLASYGGFMLPPLAGIRHLCLPTFATLGLWLTGWLIFGTPRRQPGSLSALGQAA
jgi:Glycosyltransferase family 87